MKKVGKSPIALQQHLLSICGS